MGQGARGTTVLNPVGSPCESLSLNSREGTMPSRLANADAIQPFLASSACERNRGGRFGAEQHIRGAGARFSHVSTARLRAVAALIACFAVTAAAHASPASAQESPDKATGVQAAITAKMAIILLTSSSAPLSVTFGQMEKYFVPDVNNWFYTVSYHNFAWGTVNLTNPLTVSQPPACDGEFRRHVWEAAQSAVGSSFNPSEWKTIVVVYPHQWCKVEAGSDTHWVALSDLQTIHSSGPTGAQYYTSIQEPGHTVFGSGGVHANSLDCDVAYSQSCVSGALTKLLPSGQPGNPYPCVNGGYSLPAMCEYGDPFDAMGNDWPGQRVPHSQFPGPRYSDGEAWANGVEMDHVKWLGPRKQDVNLAVGTAQTFELSPLEEQVAQHKQFLFVKPTPNMKQWLEIEYRNPPSGTSRWTDGFLSGWPSVTNGVLLHLATGLGGGSLSALLDTTPGSNPPSLCASTQNAFCDFYDAALAPGKTFIAGGGDYEITLKSVGQVGASGASAAVEISRVLH